MPTAGRVTADPLATSSSRDGNLTLPEVAPPEQLRHARSSFILRAETCRALREHATGSGGKLGAAELLRIAELQSALGDDVGSRRSRARLPETPAFEERLAAARAATKSFHRFEALLSLATERRASSPGEAASLAWEALSTLVVTVDENTWWVRNTVGKLLESFSVPELIAAAQATESETRASVWERLVTYRYEGELLKIKRYERACAAIRDTDAQCYEALLRLECDRSMSAAEMTALIESLPAPEARTWAYLASANGAKRSEERLLFTDAAQSERSRCRGSRHLDLALAELHRKNGHLERAVASAEASLLHDDRNGFYDDLELARATVRVFCAQSDFEGAKRAALAVPGHDAQTAGLIELIGHLGEATTPKLSELGNEINRRLSSDPPPSRYAGLLERYVHRRIGKEGERLSERTLAALTRCEQRTHDSSRERVNARGRVLAHEFEALLGAGKKDEALETLTRLGRYWARDSAIPAETRLHALENIFDTADRGKFPEAGPALLRLIPLDPAVYEQEESARWTLSRILRSLSAWQQLDAVEQIIRAVPVIAASYDVREHVVPALAKAEDLGRLFRIIPLLPDRLQHEALCTAVHAQHERARTPEYRSSLARASKHARAAPEPERTEYFRTLAWYAHETGERELSRRLIARVQRSLPHLEPKEAESIHRQLMYFHERVTTDGLERSVALENNPGARCKLLLGFIEPRAREMGAAHAVSLLRSTEAEWKAIENPDERAACGIALTERALALGRPRSARRYLRSAARGLLESKGAADIPSLLRASNLADQLALPAIARKTMEKAAAFEARSGSSGYWSAYLKDAVERGNPNLVRLVAATAKCRAGISFELAQLLAHAEAGDSAQGISAAALNSSDLGPGERAALQRAAGTIFDNERILEFTAAHPEAERELCLARCELAAVESGGPACDDGMLARLDGAARRLLDRNSSADSRPVSLRLKSIAACATPEAKQKLLELYYDFGGGAHSARLLEGLLDAGTHRAHDLVLDAVRDGAVDWRAGRRFVRALAARNYLDEKLLAWEKGERRARRGLPLPERRAGEREDYELMKRLLERGIVPSREVLVHLCRDGWTDGAGRPLTTIDAKIESLVSYEKRFTACEDGQSLIGLLAKDRQALYAYYILHNGDSRFSLINNYSVRQFRTVIDEAASLRIHREPLEAFAAALEGAGVPRIEAAGVISRLEHGRAPTAGSPDRLIRLDISDNTKLAAANREASAVFGARQLGVCLKVPLYRSFLASSTAPSAGALSEKLSRAETLSARAAVIREIEQAIPDMTGRAEASLAAAWTRVDAKLFLGTTLHNLLHQEENQVSCEDLVRHIERERTGLKDSHSKLLAALRGENPQHRAVAEEIKRKRRALDRLERALSIAPAVRSQAEEIRADIAALEEKRRTMNASLLGERYAALSPAERDARIAEETRKLQALIEKDPASILVYMVAGIVDEELFTEGDCAQLKEVVSHLAGPLQLARDLSGFGERGAPAAKPRLVHLHYLDKRSDLMTLARFADSKICCYSSPNYDMEVAHGLPNRRWLASSLRDPLSFVMEIQDAGAQGAGANGAKVNIGFVIGSFAVSGGRPGLLLNGIYLASGCDAKSAASVLNAVEESISRPLGLEWQLVASEHGGAISGEVARYERTTIDATRLRALAGGDGMPETQIYDDLGTEVNTETSFTGYYAEFPRSAAVRAELSA